MRLTYSIIKSTNEGIAKVEQYGVKTADLAQPFGEDSNPIEGMVAIFSDTESDGESVIIGYIDPNKLAEVGEKRLYSMDSSGAVGAYIWLKNNGQLQLNGDSDNLCKYKELEKVFEKLKNDINIELAKIQTGIVGAKSSYAKKDITVDPSKIKVENLECS